MIQLERMSEQEISLSDILRFLKSAYKAIFIAGFGGLLISSAYIYLTPKQYEAVALISVAQIAVSNNSNNNNTNLTPLGINIEEPSLVVARFSSPTSFTPRVLSSCAQEAKFNTPSTVAESIKLTIPKGVANALELKVYGASQETVRNCAQDIFELIKNTQAELISPFIEEAQAKLLEDRGRLQKARDMVAKADQSGVALSAAYLSTKDEIRFLLDEITMLTNVVSTNKSRVTRLVSPIYVGDAPVFPKKSLVLAAGLGGGIFLGLLLVLVRKNWNEANVVII